MVLQVVFFLQVFAPTQFVHAFVFFTFIYLHSLDAYKGHKQPNRMLK